MTVGRKLNELFNELYLCDNIINAEKSVTDILEFINKIHFSTMDELSSRLTKITYQKSFMDYLENFNLTNNPFLYQIDTIRQVLSFHYRFHEL